MLKSIIQPFRYQGRNHWKNLKRYILQGLSFFKFLVLKLQHKQLMFYFLVFIFYKDLMKKFYFPVLIFFFCDPCLYATLQKFRLLDYVILLRATILGMTLKGLFVLNKIHSWLVRLIWERQMLVIITKYNISTILFNFLKQNTALKVLFALISVNKLSWSWGSQIAV